MLCVVSSTEHFFSTAVILLTTPHMNLRDTGSMPVDGSDDGI
jgi:hypothetical protein